MAHLNSASSNSVYGSGSLGSVQCPNTLAAFDTRSSRANSSTRPGYSDGASHGDVFTRTGQSRPQGQAESLSEYGAEAIVVANWAHKDRGTDTLNIYDAEDGNFPVIHIEMLVNQNGRRICLRDHVK
jgi:hypothetical protein